MRVLVTGGAGFIGSNFIRYFLQNNSSDEVVNFDALTYAGNLENLRDIEDEDRYRFVRGDITDRDEVFRVVQDVDAVVHFAAESHVDRSIMDSAIFVKTNVLGTQNILDAVREYDKRLHHISTDEVFGHLGPTDPPFTEKSPYDPRSPYSASKAGADHLVRAYYNTFGVRATISNCSNNYGPHCFPEKLIPLFISNLMRGENVPLYGDGGQVRDWIYVDDHSRGIDMILRNGRIGETYCLGGGSERKNIDIARKLIELLGVDESLIAFVPDRPGHDRRYAIDFSKVRAELGWEPMVSFDDGLERTVRWYRDNQAWVDNCRNGEYREYYKNQYQS